MNEIGSSVSTRFERDDVLHFFGVGKKGTAMADRDTFDKRQSRLSPESTSNSQEDKKPQGRLYLPLAFEPGNWDVICHNGREFQQHGKANRFSEVSSMFVISQICCSTIQLGTQDSNFALRVTSSNI